MRSYYSITTNIKNYLVAHSGVNTIVIGNISDIDIQRQTIYPLAQLVVGNSTFSNNTVKFDMRVLIMDSVYVSKNDPKSSDEFTDGVDNKQDVYNSTLSVINGLQHNLKNGRLASENYRLEGEPIAVPFEDAYGNLLTGWSLEFTVVMPNIDVSSCAEYILGEEPEDTRVYNSANPYGVSLAEFNALLQDVNELSDSVNEHIDDSTIHFTQGDISISSSQVVDLVHTDISSLNSYTSSNDTNQTVQDNRLSSIESVTASLDSTYEQQGSGILSGSVVDKLPVGVVSGSSQIDVTQTTNYSSINQYTDTDTLEYLNSIQVLSGSKTDITSLNTYTSSNDTTNSGQDSRLDSLESVTSSLDSTYELQGTGILSGSKTDITSLNEFTSSIQTEVDGISAQTSSYLLNTTDTLVGNLGVTGTVTANSLSGSYLDLLDGDIPSYREGRMYYDNVNKTYSLYNDESETSLQIGQEQRVRVYNDTLNPILNGQIVSVVGVTVDSVVKVDLAISSDKVSALNTIGIATHEIEVGTYGWATTSGVVNDVDTSILTEGAALYLSSTDSGSFQLTRPTSPSYEVRMGGVISSNVDGKIYAELRIIDNDHDVSKFFNGSILEDHNVTIDTTPTTTTLTLDDGGDFLSLLLDQEFLKIPVPASIVLTNGTDTVPIHNYVYVNSVGDLTISTTSFPIAEQFVPIATVLLQSAVSANTYGPYKVHQWSDHLASSTGQGHLSHLNAWIRNKPATWESGTVLSIVEGVPSPTIDVSYTSGVIYQLHRHNFPVTDTSVGTKLYEINNPITPYIQRDNISPLIDTDSLGNAISNNKFYKLVIWGAISEELEDCKLYFNLPNGSYTNVTDALNDVDKTTNYTLPVEFLGTGFLLTEMVIQRGTTSVEVITDSVKDLRGLVPSTGAGGGTTGGAGVSLFTELTDTPISITADGIVKGNGAGTSLEMVSLESILPIGTVSGSEQVLDILTPVNEFTSSIQTQVDDLFLDTSNIQTQVDTLNVFTSSIQTQVDGISAQTSSYLIDSDLSSLNSYTASNDITISNLNEFTSSIQTEVDTINLNAAFKDEVNTFTLANNFLDTITRGSSGYTGQATMRFRQSTNISTGWNIGYTSSNSNDFYFYGYEDAAFRTYTGGVLRTTTNAIGFDVNGNIKSNGNIIVDGSINGIPMTSGSTLDSIAIGVDASVSPTANYGIAIGYNAIIDDAGDNRFDGIAIGRNSFISRDDTISIGRNSFSIASKGTAIGARAESSKTNSTALGYDSTTTKDNQVVLGDVNVTEVLTAGSIVALGGNSTQWNSAFGWGDHSLGGYEPEFTKNTAFNKNFGTTAGTVLEGDVSSTFLKNTTDTLDGDLTVTGIITAQEFHTEFVNSSIIYESGSTKFGDTSDDTHEFTGSLSVEGVITSTGGTSTNWNSAFGWGDHSTEGYLTDASVQTKYLRSDVADTFAGGTLSIDDATGVSGNSNKISFATDRSWVGYNGGNFQIQTSTGKGLAFKTDNASWGASSPDMYIYQGNVGIGTTSPDTDLHIDGLNSIFTIGKETITNGHRPGINIFGYDSSAQSGLSIFCDYEDSKRSAHIYTNANTSQLKLDTSTGNGNIILETGTGNVGIGRTVPTSRLDILGNDNTDILTLRRGGDAQRLVFRGYQMRSEGNHMLVSADDTKQVWLGHTTATTEMVVDVGGNVGIGTNAPTTKLQVDGIISGSNIGTDGLNNGITRLGFGTATGTYSTCIGYDTIATGANAIGIGRRSSATGDNSIGIGYDADATANYAIAIGYDTKVKSSSDIAIGLFADADAGNGLAIGVSSKVLPGHQSSTAIGYSAETTKAKQIVLGDTTLVEVKTSGNVVAESFECNTTNEITGTDAVLKVVSCTQAEYDAGTPTLTTLYIITT